MVHFEGHFFTIPIIFLKVQIWDVNYVDVWKKKKQTKKFATKTILVLETLNYLLVTDIIANQCYGNQGRIVFHRISRKPADKIIRN